MWTVLAGGFLAAHGLIHASYASKPPAPKPGAPPWPFRLDRSWLLSGIGLPTRTVRVIGVALTAAVVAGFVLAGAGIVFSAAWWAPVAIAAAALSMAQLALYFHPWLSLGLAIDVVILAVAL